MSTANTVAPADKPAPSLFAGLDVGSTTLKIVITDSAGEILFTDYRRHNADVPAALRAAFAQARDTRIGNAPVSLTVTGSAGMGLSETYRIPFIQEVVAAGEVAQRRYPDIRTLVDIGGEDAKMIFFSPGRAPDIRMNGSCAGGTGAFIDQVATLLGCEVSELNELAKNSTALHPIASRCGVFAKTDIQNLLARNVSKADIAASVFHAVALQLVTSLARGREIAPLTLLCGGPLAFIPELRKACLKVMGLTDDDCVVPDAAALIPALGCALATDTPRLAITIDELLARFANTTRAGRPLLNGQPLRVLFDSAAEHEAWKIEKQRYALPRAHFADLPENGEIYLGIDSGSTTTKIVATDARENVLHTFYEKNSGDPLAVVAKGLAGLNAAAIAAGRPALRLARAAVTGYGEDLIKAAFNFDSGLVETIAHYLAAHKLNPEVTFILDIGGQDMKATFIENGSIVRLDINEACSSGCGSFIESFANTLGQTAAQFATSACTAEYPCDLGTRCTVFMNSKVKQSLREGSTLPDIAAGIAYSVVKNCLYKVLKLKNVDDLGAHIVVQGGTMRNHAVVRALEHLTDRDVAFADMPELMGAYGAAIHASRANPKPQVPNSKGSDFHPSPFTLLSSLAHPATSTTEETTCPGCENKCVVRKYTFANANTFFSGNKCEKIFTNRGADTRKGENIYAFKYSKLFGRTAPSPAAGAIENRESKIENPITIGIPRALNYYENYPFWHALLTHAGMKVTLSSRSTFELYGKGVHTVMSDNICFPAKLVHGHIYDLIARKVDRILMPFVVYEEQEDKNAVNTYNCPIVTGYSDVIRSAINPEGKHGIPLDAPTLSFRDRKLLERACRDYMTKTLGVAPRAFERAFAAALAAQTEHFRTLAEKARAIAARAAAENRVTILLAGRPYHADPLIQHKVADMIAGFGVDVISEDLVRLDDDTDAGGPGSVRQWAYTNRILKSARWVAEAPSNVHFVQLTSFGCGPDAFIIDEAGDILRRNGKSHTILKIDDISNLGSLRLRIRSLVESLAYRGSSGMGDSPMSPPANPNRWEKLPASPATARKLSLAPNPHGRVAHATQSTQPLTTPIFTEADRHRTILLPFFSEVYSPFIPMLLGLMGYKCEVMPPSDAASIDFGLKYANNEVCYPATLVVGDIVRALNSGKYKPDEIAIGISQTGGQCRASNYIALIKKAMIATGHGNIPVVSLGTSSGAVSNTQPGFKLKLLGNLSEIIGSVFYADRISQMYYASVPREREPGSAARLRDEYIQAAIARVAVRDTKALYRLLAEAAADFNAICDHDRRVPRIGIVGEIYVKYNSIGNKNVVQWLIDQGAEAVVPSVATFFLQEFPNHRTNIEQHLKHKPRIPFLDTAAFALIRRVEKKFDRAASSFAYFHPSHNPYEQAKSASRVLNIASQYGEGWLIPAELAGFAERGVMNAVSLQPFGCIANHLVSKGIEKRIRDLYPDMSLLFLDLDSGASEANMMNRLHFMLQNARNQVEQTAATVV
ncbi:putative CoA-substrate-specific enzyme activase [Ereboglobus sp. PH5-10]|uniref:acyl-CoA dehydratase activase-related protein n=1 Tax=Ereboglobus sp. PH5-10 TaxID=2940629 RepID=UPI0024068DB2|nr:acyl-CoA dehydratase activase-related protein [Ereboglobus sp. PH5-10]MDF9827468.1 putative CoA-substrate-specific enzyme activase [Ereboglobus sp. PH5-10]